MEFNQLFVLSPNRPERGSKKWTKCRKEPGYCPKIFS